MKRKRYYRAFALLLALAAGASALTGCGGSAAGAASVEKYQREDVVMGTTTTAVVYSSGEDVTADIMERLSHVEDDYISWRVENSDIDKINKGAGDPAGVQIGKATAGYLNQVLDIAEQTEGAFDPTIGKITRLWDIDGKNPHVPAPEEIESLLADCGYKKISLDGDRVTLEKNASIDLGAVGKGIGCDEAVKFLESEPDVSGAVISVGGSIVVYGEKPDGSDWQVAITNPDDDREYFGILTLQGVRYASTSGDYEKYFEENGKRYHHIMDPSIGYPAESGLTSVSVITDNGLLSDGLSTACFVLGREKSLPVLDYYGAEAIFVDRNHQVYVTEGIQKNFAITDEKFIKTW